MVESLFYSWGCPLVGSKKASVWYSFVERIRSRLSRWKSKNIYVEDWFVLSSISVCTVDGRGCEDFRKLSWIKYDILCLQMENGGLGVMRLKEFNLSLLEK